MAKFMVTFEQTFPIEADNEEEAYEKAIEFASEYRIDECNDVTVEEV